MSKLYFLVLYRLVRTGHWFTDQVGQVLKADGITEPQYNVLRILSQAHPQPCAVQEIQKNMIQRSSNVTRIIDKLIQKGYVMRRECPANRRKMDISLTASGEEVLKKLNQEVYDFHLPMIDNLTEAELKTLRQLLIKLTSPNYE